MRIPESLEELVNTFSQLPGIGKKSARRLSFHILTTPKEKAEALAYSIINAREKIKECSVCYNFTENDPCEFCENPGRNEKLICVVEKASDIISFEASGVFKGQYHVLGGYLSPLDGVGPNDLHIYQLINRIKKNEVEELILALGTSADAESTAMFIDKALGDFEIRKTRLARGIPVGSDLEFVDELTVLRAFENRIDL